MPLYYGIAESFSRPEFNPLDQDVLFDDALETARSESARDSIRRAAETYTSRPVSYTTLTVPNKSRVWNLVRRL